MNVREFLMIQSTETSPVDIDLYVKGRYVETLVYVRKGKMELEKEVLKVYQNYIIISWWIDDYIDPNLSATLNLEIKEPQ